MSATAEYTTIIGLEVHVQLQTQTKIFCGCSTRFNPDNPNVQTCPVCLGLPGSLPVINGEAYRLAVKTALAINCEIARFTKWDRKQYYYPDLPKGYQISQYDLPMSHDGWLEIRGAAPEDPPRRIGIIRAHLEEDAGKNMHDETGRGNDSQVDLNRAGTPLLEIVSQPDLRSAAEAKEYLQELRLLLTYLQVSDCNMQEGSLRCDANVNLHIQREGEPKIATPIVEIKNLNSFRNVELAIEYEVARQYEEWKKTGKTFGQVVKETRGYDAVKNVTFSQRGKEEASDYRYFPDPDLVPVTITDAEIEEVRNAFIEFPAARRARLMQQHALSAYDAAVIIDQGQVFADYVEEVTRICGDGKQACNWVTQDALREMNDRKLTIEEFPIPPEVLGEILRLVNLKKITIKSGREIFMILLDSDPASISVARIEQLIQEKNLAIVSDTGALDGVIDTVLGKNAKAVADFKGGKQAAMGALIGQVMREVRGADPNAVRERLIEKLNSL